MHWLLKYELWGYIPILFRVIYVNDRITTEWKIILVENYNCNLWGILERDGHLFMFKYFLSILNRKEDKEQYEHHLVLFSFCFWEGCTENWKSEMRCFSSQLELNENERITENLWRVCNTLQKIKKQKIKNCVCFLSRLHRNYQTYAKTW